MVSSLVPETLVEQGTEAFSIIAEWGRQLPVLDWQTLVPDAQEGKVAIFCVDMINGFCHEGLLASPRVKGILPEVVAVFEQAYTSGVRDFILAQDCHTPDSVEFADFPPHCLATTSEADNIPELAQLPFANLYTTIYKNSLNAFHGTELSAWIESHSQIKTAIVVGDCTDLCIYQMAMHLKLASNAANHALRVIVPANAVQTYDTPVATAREIGAFPHSGDVMHWFSLYHMRLNGVEVVREIV